MTMMASQITSLTVVYSIVYSDVDQRKHQSSASLAFVRGIHRDRWIPRTKGQLRGKCFHLMTSSCWSKEVRCEADWERKALYRNSVQPCSTPLPIHDWASIRSSNTQCKSSDMITHGVCGYSSVMTSWCSCNSSCGWSPLTPKGLRRISQSLDSVVPGDSHLRGWFQVVPISCRRYLNHRIFCMAQPSAVLKLVCSIPIVLSLSTMVRP